LYRPVTRTLRFYADRRRLFLKRILSSKWTKVLLFLLGLAPFAHLVWRGVHQDLGANPVEFIQHDLGDWTLLFLIATLLITPARRILHLPALIRFRRMLGLFAFFYACLHVTTYVWLDQQLSLSSMMKDVVKRPFITAGFVAFASLVPLALTSTAGWIRRLGGRRWQALHRLIYLAAAAGVVHYYWLVKSDVRKPLRFGIVVGALLAYRLVYYLIGRRRVPPARGGVQPDPEPELSTAERA
jgi:sulfoxide reductase heme-binding subunit YedZ